MKSLTLLLCFLSINATAEVSRSPAVVGGICDIDIETTIVATDSKKIFTEVLDHKVEVLSDEILGCSGMPKKQFPSSTYEAYARNEMGVLFKKYPETYSKKCHAYFLSQGLRKSEYNCGKFSIASLKIGQFSCEKRIEEGSIKATFVGVAHAVVAFEQVGYKLEEKSVQTVQKEQCARVNDCMGQAQEKELAELKKLSVVACKNEVSPISSGRAPAIEKDATNFDGKRNPKNTEEKVEQSNQLEHNQTEGK